jgi:hypothetical protein
MIPSFGARIGNTTRARLAMDALGALGFMSWIIDDQSDDVSPMTDHVPILVWAFALLPTLTQSHPATPIRGDAAPRPFTSVPDILPTAYAMLDRPASRFPSHLGQRACGSRPLVARLSFFPIAVGSSAQWRCNLGDPACVGRNPILRC